MTGRLDLLLKRSGGPEQDSHTGCLMSGKGFADRQHKAKQPDLLVLSHSLSQDLSEVALLIPFNFKGKVNRVLN